MFLSLMFCFGFLFLPLARTDQMIIPVLHAMERLVDFYQTDFTNLNVDGLFGLRVLEGHFDLILKKSESLKLSHLDPNIVTRIRTMKIKCSQTAGLAMKHVKQDNINYFNQLSYVVGSPWDVFDHERRKVDPTKVWTHDIYHHAKKSVKLDEEISDKCMSELIGSHQENGRLCDISTSCVKTMTSPGLVGYGNTHQILWSMLAEKAGCTKQLEGKLKEANKGTLVSLRREMCSNNYYQLMETLAKMDNNLITPAFQDLFLEQLFICPSLGYYEFLHPDFIPQILSWQLELGCYGKMKRHKNPVELDKSLKGKFTNDYDDDDYDDFERLLEGLQVKNDVNDKVLMYNDTAHQLGQKFWEITHNKGRKLLVEKTMTGGCLAHKTAVASGALVMYLRFLCEPDATVTFNRSGMTRSSKHSAIDTKHLPGNVGDTLDVNLVNPGVKNAPGVMGGDKGKDLATSLTHVNANDIIQNMGVEADRKIRRNVNVMNDSRIVNSSLDVKNDMSDLNHHLNALNAPDLNEQNVERKGNTPKHFLVGKDPVMIKSAENNDIEEQEGDMDDEDSKDGTIVKDVNNDDIDEDYDDDDDDENNFDNQNKVDKNDDEYYDDGDELQADDSDLALGKNHLTDFNDEDGYDREEDENDDYDAGYDDNDQNNMDNNADIHPHINLRNIGHRDYRLNEGNDNNLMMNHDYTYKYDDDDDEENDDEDNYEYDDENDEMAKRRQEDIKGDLQYENLLKTTKSNRKSAMQRDILHSEVTVSPTTAFFVFGFCITLVLILMYKFIKKRRIRIRFNPKYFSV